MEKDMMSVLLLVIIVVQFIIIFCLLSQKNSIEKNLKEIATTINHIVTYNTDEKIMSFSGNNYVIELIASINIILNKYQKAKANYRRTELSSKRMLANISHDLKTPLTVILGYSEMLMLSDFCEKNTIRKINEKSIVGEGSIIGIFYYQKL